MSLRAFHLLFIAMSIVLAAFFGAWAIGQYRVEHQTVFVVTAVAAFVGAVGLAVYAAVFQRKTRSF